MSTASIRFRTRGGPRHGWGNIHRLADFAHLCREKGHSSMAFLAEGPAEVIDYLTGRGFTTHALGEDIDLEEEGRILAGHGAADVTITEMLDCTPGRQALLKAHTGKLVVIDDLLDHRYAADLVICGQALPGYGNMDISDPATRFLTGYDYFMFPPGCRAYAERDREYAAEAKSVLVAFGGGDYGAAYIKTARAIAALDGGVEATFVLGYAGGDALAREIKALLPDADVLGGVDTMGDLLWETDMAVVSGGYLKLEAAITGTPAVIGATQWHQIPLAEEFAARTDAIYVGYMGFVTPDAVKRALEDLMPVDRRRTLAGKARAVVDGRGAERVYDAIIEIWSNP